MKEKVHITGAYGLVGNLVYAKLAANKAYEVFGSGRRSDISKRANADIITQIPDSHFSIVDVSDLQSVRNAVEGMDVMIHIAADPRPEAPIDALISSNILGTYNVLEACRDAGVGRFIYASSIMINMGQYYHEEPYKSIQKRRFENVPNPIPMITPDDPVRPTVPYAASKIWGEAICRTYAESHGFSVVCIRIGVVVSDDKSNSRFSSIYCSHADIAEIHQLAVEATKKPIFEIVYGMSDNTHRWVDTENAREVLGFVSQTKEEDVAPKE